MKDVPTEKYSDIVDKRYELVNSLWYVQKVYLEVQKVYSISNYVDLHSRANFFSEKFKRGKIDEINIDNLESLVKEFWKVCISSLSNILIRGIEKRKTRGVEFSKVLQDLREIIKDVEHEEYDVYELQTIYEADLLDLRDEIIEKLEIEKSNRNWDIKLLLIGAVVGAIIGLILGVFFKVNC